MYSIRNRSRSLFFIIGLLFMALVTLKDSAQEAGNKAEPGSPIAGEKLLTSALRLEDAMAGTSPTASAGAASTAETLPVRPVQTTVEVNAGNQTLTNVLSAPYHVTQSDVMSSAGTWGDFTRYLQVLPGVVWNADMSNDLVVRGGHPSENLFVVDGIEVPNINHIAVEGSSGGFTSMIDTSTVGNVELKAGVYDARYSSRLSSLIDIHTLDGQGGARAGNVDLGISGAGGFIERPIAGRGSLLLSAHRSLLNLVTQDIGLNGVPIYTNGMARLEWSPSKSDHVTALSLNGSDSIDIRPCSGDDAESLNINTQYAGTRSTDGLVWRHVHNASTVSTLTGSYSLQSQKIGQQEQDPSSHSFRDCKVHGVTDVYDEQTSDGISTLGYSLQLDRRGWFYSMGTTGRLVGVNYTVAQPVGVQSPFNANSSRTAVDSFSRRFATGQTGTYMETNGRIGTRWTVTAGAREETFAVVGAHAFEPRGSLAFRINDHQAVDLEFGRSAQLAPLMNLLSYAQNARLAPIRVEQFLGGADLWRMDRASLSIQAYHKRYFNEPASTEYSSLMMANMVDTLGQEFMWLPLNSGGHGQANGVEMLLRAHWPNHLQLLGTTSYSRTRYAAADGVLRPGNFDFPLVANGMATLRLPLAIQLSVRNTYASGRPYTPFNVPLSEQQHRGIFDLTRTNALRGPAYNRLDFEFSRGIHIRKGLMNIQGGMENAIDRENLLGYAWLTNCRVSGACANAQGIPMAKVPQMPRFPSFSVRYDF